jgi:N-dimethylarginine dimethylaminohydrolase
MSWSVYQHWDPLEVCVVGRSYPPEFYSWVTIPHVRELFERIAIETEEDYQKIISKLREFNVEILRPDLPRETFKNGRYVNPPMAPRDRMAMIGNTLYDHTCDEQQQYQHILDRIHANGNEIKSGLGIHGAMVAPIGYDLFFGTDSYSQNKFLLKEQLQTQFPNNRVHVINTGGHSDATYCPVCPGLIISLYDVPTYADTYPGWEVVYLPGQSWDAIKPFQRLKERNRGRWWIPGFEQDAEVIEFVESWLGHWTGYIEETVFDVNMLIVDPKNVLVFGYNQQVFDALQRYQITPHIVPFRHRYFWDGGIHCVTADLHRKGVIQQYF